MSHFSLRENKEQSSSESKNKWFKSNCSLRESQDKEHAQGSAGSQNK
jgi:hypothetical protein